MVPDDGCILKRNHGASPYTFDVGIVGCRYERQQFVFILVIGQVVVSLLRG